MTYERRSCVASLQQTFQSLGGGLLAAALISSSSAEAQDVKRIPAAPYELPDAKCQAQDGVRPDPTLVNTDPFVLAKFPLERVYQQLITLSGLGAPTAVELHQQLWDTTDESSNAAFFGPHCDDNGTTINGFPIDCPRPDAVLKNTPPKAFKPVALFNRFDLASSDGSNCGEYRIVYALDDNGVSPRDFIIFEGVLPNPQPGCGLDACRPVVKFWENLASYNPNTAAGQAALTKDLERFYFKGLSGFEPVVHPDHYGVKGGGGYGEPSGGQIRTNLFFEPLWQLREYHLVPGKDKDGSAKLLIDPVSVKTNPFYKLWDPNSTDPYALGFQSVFPSEVTNLSNNNVATLTTASFDKFNAGQSTSQGNSEDYRDVFAPAAPGNSFWDAIDAQIAPSSGLTPPDITARALTQACHGCHELSNGDHLGGVADPVWPFSRRFVHVDEQSNLSQALWCVFLPHRKSVLDGFFASSSTPCEKIVEPTPVVVVDEKQLRAELPKVDPAGLSVAAKLVGPN